MSHNRTPLEVLPRPARIALWLGLAALLAFPLLPLEGGEFYLKLLTQMMILAIFAMSLDLLQGVTGLVSLGHAAYFGLAGYALAFLTPPGAPVSLWWSLPVAALGSGAAALVIGFFVVRTKGIYFIMVTMAFAQMVYFLFFDNKALGGSDGLYVNLRPSLAIAGFEPFSLDDRTVFYYLALALLAAVYLLLRRLLFSPFGRALAGIRTNEHRMRAIGYSTFSHKLVAFTLAGTLAGVAGYLWAAQTGYVNPDLMGFHMSAHAIMMVILGGMGNFAGAIVGTLAFETLLHLFKDMTRHWQLLMGGFIVAVVLVAPRGLLGWLACALPSGPIAFFGGVNPAVFRAYTSLLQRTTGQEDAQAALTRQYLAQPCEAYRFPSDILGFDPQQGHWLDLGAGPVAGCAGSAIAVRDGVVTLIQGEAKPGLRSTAVWHIRDDGDTLHWQPGPSAVADTRFTDSGDAARAVDTEGLAGAFAGHAGPAGDVLLLAGGTNFPGARARYSAGQRYAHEGLTKTWQDGIFALQGAHWRSVGRLPRGTAHAVGCALADGLLLIGGETMGGVALDSVVHLRWDDVSGTVTCQDAP